MFLSIGLPLSLCVIVYVLYPDCIIIGLIFIIVLTIIHVVFIKIDYELNEY